MRKREIFWIGVVLLLGWAYVHFFTNFGVTRSILISPSLRPAMNRRGVVSGSVSVYPVFFTLDGSYRLTSVKVTTAETNPAGPGSQVLWHLVSKDGSDPVKFFSYGENLNGMTPDIQGVRIEPLQTNVTYHLELMAGKIKGGTNFVTRAIPN